MPKSTCPKHGAYSSPLGFSCPTCRDIRRARDIVEYQRSNTAFPERVPAYRNAAWLLEHYGEAA